MYALSIEKKYVHVPFIACTAPSMYMYIILYNNWNDMVMYSEVLSLENAHAFKEPGCYNQSVHIATKVVYPARTYNQQC